MELLQSGCTYFCCQNDSYRHLLGDVGTMFYKDPATAIPDISCLGASNRPLWYGERFLNKLFRSASVPIDEEMPTFSNYAGSISRSYKQGILSLGSSVQNENPVQQEVLSEETSPGSASELSQCHTIHDQFNREDT